jgi:rhodanese-related sulfurtransferase/rubrerythrin
MEIASLFRGLPTMSVEQVRAYIDQREPSQYTLLDVREVNEYEESHLPGAVLIPVGELPNRYQELDPAKPTIVYCRSGGRGGSGTGVLVHAGFGQVWNMAGGMMAWQGLTATGAPEAGIAWFDEAHTLDDYIALASLLEVGARRFYEEMAIHLGGEDAELFRSLAKAEEDHISLLASLRVGDGDQDTGARHEQEEQDVMEGGISLQVTLTWARQQPPISVLELAIAMECNAYDRYLRVAALAKDKEVTKALEALACEEKTHLDRLVRAFAVYS